MKTPREIIAETNIGHNNQLGHDFAHYIETRLADAGFVIVPKELSEERRAAFNRVGNWYPDTTDTILIWRDLAKFMSKP